MVYSTINPPNREIVSQDTTYSENDDEDFYPNQSEAPAPRVPRAQNYAEGDFKYDPHEIRCSTIELEHLAESFLKFLIEQGRLHIPGIDPQDPTAVDLFKLSDVFIGQERHLLNLLEAANIQQRLNAFFHGRFNDYFDLNPNIQLLRISAKYPVGCPPKYRTKMEFHILNQLKLAIQRKGIVLDSVHLNSGVMSTHLGQIMDIVEAFGVRELGLDFRLYDVNDEQVARSPPDDSYRRLTLALTSENSPIQHMRLKFYPNEVDEFRIADFFKDLHREGGGPETKLLHLTMENVEVDSWDGWSSNCHDSINLKWLQFLRATSYFSELRGLRMFNFRCDHRAAERLNSHLQTEHCRSMFALFFEKLWVPPAYHFVPLPLSDAKDEEVIDEEDIDDEDYGPNEDGSWTRAIGDYGGDKVWRLMQAMGCSMLASREYKRLSKKTRMVCILPRPWLNQKISEDTQFDLLEIKKVVTETLQAFNSHYFDWHTEDPHGCFPVPEVFDTHMFSLLRSTIRTGNGLNGYAVNLSSTRRNREEGSMLLPARKRQRTVDTAHPEGNNPLFICDTINL